MDATDEESTPGQAEFTHVVRKRLSAETDRKQKEREGVGSLTTVHDGSESAKPEASLDDSLAASSSSYGQDVPSTLATFIINDQRIPLPQAVDRSVAEAIGRMVLDVARNGVGELREAGGMLVIAGPADKLRDLGQYDSLVNKFEGKDIRVQSLSDRVKSFVYETFIQDGATIIDGHTGRIIASRYRVTEGLELGDDGGGLKHKAASAIAQTGLCLSIKCSEDNCQVNGIGKGHLKVFPAQKLPIDVAVRPVSPEMRELKLLRTEVEELKCQQGKVTLEPMRVHHLKAECTHSPVSTSSTTAGCSSSEQSEGERPHVLVIFPDSAMDWHQVKQRFDVLHKFPEIRVETADSLIEFGRHVKRFKPHVIHVEAPSDGNIKWRDPTADVDEPVPIMPQHLAKHIFRRLSPTGANLPADRCCGCILNFGSTPIDAANDWCDNCPGHRHVVAWGGEPKSNLRQTLLEEFYENYSFPPEEVNLPAAFTNAYCAAAANLLPNPNLLFIRPTSIDVSTSSLGDKRQIRIELSSDVHQRSGRWRNKSVGRMFEQHLRDWWMEQFGEELHLNRDVEACFVTQPAIEFPARVTPEELQIFEASLQSSFPVSLPGRLLVRQLGSVHVCLAATGSVHVCLAATAFDELEKIQLGATPVWFEVPPAWGGGGHVRLDQISFGDHQWVDFVVPSFEVADILFKDLANWVSKYLHQAFEEKIEASTKDVQTRPDSPIGAANPPSAGGGSAPGRTGNAGARGRSESQSRGDGEIR